jgi:hypothetical protein
MSSPYLISGQLRREKKKELSHLKSFVKNFWFYEDVDRVYGGGLDDSTCHKMIREAGEKIKLLESELVEPSIDTTRDNKMNLIFENKDDVNHN